MIYVLVGVVVVCLVGNIVLFEDWDFVVVVENWDVF